MTLSAKDVMIECTQGSDAEAMTFPEVVGRLMAAGVERYRADLVRSEKVYYMPDGSSVVVPAHSAPLPAQPFSAAGVDAAVRAVQAGHIKYREFSALIAAAGCVDYLVSLTGRCAIYFGRSGESHTEPFPGPR
ncbi:MAG: DUF1398 family protein [Rhodospirillaceae bacterium]|nr:DUF1398 family protein [Rhodospirillaceae bacterium]